MSMPPALARRRRYAGPILFSYGFRPFFLAGAMWAAFAVFLWLPQYLGAVTLPTALAPIDWHVHEMLYGYVAAVIAGFLLTAIPNWTGRLPVNGWPLAGLVALWAAGRFAICVSIWIGAPLAAVVDVSFLVVLAAVASREVIAGRNWRNLRVLGVLAVLIAGNILFHIDVLRGESTDVAVRLGLAAIIGLIMLIGGRIIPSFTHNWLARQRQGRLPASFGRYDIVCLAVAAVALALWVVTPTRPASGAVLIIAGLLHLLRLARWAGERTLGERLVLVLHVAYAFVPIGFLLTGAAALWPQIFPTTAGIHAWTTGAIGLMTLAVMTRASLGHTGHALVASAWTQTIYVFVLTAVCLRIVAAFVPSIPLLHVAAAAWIAAFTGFAWAFGPIIARGARARVA